MAQPADEGASCLDGTVLISESDLEGVESGDGPLNPYDAFRGMRPVAILQDGVYVYRGHFTLPLASAWVDVRDSQQLSKAGQAQEALALAQRAVTLAPNSTRAQLNLADLLGKGGNWVEARAHYEAAQHSLETNRPELEEDEFGAGVAAGLAHADAHAPR